MGFHRFLLLSIILLANLLVNGQEAKVIDEETKQALEGVTFFSEQPKAFAVSNLYGKVDLSPFKGADLIQIRSLGFKNVELSYEEIKAENYEIKLNSFDLPLEEVVISANRWRQTSSEVAANLATIKPKEIQFQNPQTAADMLGASGKVFIQKSQQGGGSPMIRGFATNRLLYSVDGVRMNTAIFRGGNIQNVINLDPHSLESTEILFGPASVSYGSDAIGGVMSFRTYEPQFSLNKKVLVKGKASSRIASANQEKSGHFDLNLGFKNWASFTSFSHWNYGDLRQGSHGPDSYLKPFYVERRNGEDLIIDQKDELLQIPSAYSQSNFLQKVRYRANEHWEFTYSFNYSETSSYGRYDRHNRLRNGLPRYAEWSYGPQKWMMNLMSAENYQSTPIYDELLINLAQQNFQESRISRNFNSNNREIREEEVNAYSLNLDLNKRLDTKNTLFYGAEWVLNQVSSKGFDQNILTDLRTPAASRYPDANWTSAALFLNNEHQLNEKTKLLGGLRYNYYQLEADFRDNLDFYPFPFERATIVNNALTASLGSVYKPNDKWIFKGNLGTAFRSPNVDDIGKVFDSEPGSVVVPNTNLQAEYAYNIDLGFAKLFGDHLKIDITAFYTLLENAMVRRNFQLSGQDSIFYDGELSQVQAIQNAAEARVYGLQFGFEAKLNPYFSLSWDINFQEGEEKTDDGMVSPSRHAAPLFGVGRINYEKKRTRIQFYVEFQGGFEADELAISERSKTEIYALNSEGESYVPQWHTFNLKVQQGIADHIFLAGGVENIADLRYRPYSSGISAPGRNFYISITAKL